MRCIIKGCNITCKHPRKSMCWVDFNMCKYHAYEFYPEVYDVYRPTTLSKWDQLVKRTVS